MNTDIIGRNSTHLWQLMNDGTPWTYKRIKDSTGLSDREINAAIGWLAREESLESYTDPHTGTETFVVRQFWESALI